MPSGGRRAEVLSDERATATVDGMTQALPRITVGEAASHLLLWRHAVQLQAIRILTPSTGMPDGPFSRQVDCYMFAVAVRNVRRGGELLRQVAPARCGSAIDIATNAFDARVPHAVDLRDVLDHFDAYALGKGRLQDPNGFLPVAWYEDDGKTYRYSIGVSAAKPLLTIDVKDACEAASAFSSSVMDAVA